jgi:hypothetical protein
MPRARPTTIVDKKWTFMETPEGCAYAPMSIDVERLGGDDFKSARWPNWSAESVAALGFQRLI